MKHYRIYFLDLHGKIDGRPVELEAASDSEVIVRALMAERNMCGAEVWCGATLVRRVGHAGPQAAFMTPGEQGVQADAQN